MLVLERGTGQVICISGQKIKVHVIRIRNGKVRLGIEASKNVTIHREEIQERIDAGNQAKGKTEEVCQKR